MKQSKCILATILAGFCSFTSIWADLVPPTQPASQTPETGKIYYLFNKSQNLFLGESKDNSNYAGIVTEGLPWTIEKDSKTKTYTLKHDASFLIQYYNGNAGMQSGTPSNRFWNILTTNGAYALQCPESHNEYVATEFLGFDSLQKHDYAVYNAKSDYEWLLFSEAEGKRYVAETALHKALLKGSEYKYYVTPYANLYDNRAKETPETLLDAAHRLDNGIDLSATVASPSWSNYKLLLETDPYLKWKNNEEGISFYESNKVIDSTSIKSFVKIDKTAVLRYKYQFNEGWELDLYVNGKKIHALQYNHNNSHPQYYELQPGDYTLEWRYVNKGKKDYTSIGLSTISIEYTPNIAVNLLEPGSLGTEVLYNVNHVKDVRSLKVKGEMNADDWAKIRMMKNLYQLDLSEAQSTFVPENQFSNLDFFYQVRLPQNVTVLESRSFYDSHITQLDFPQSVKTIKESVFYNSNIKEFVLPQKMDSIYARAFNNCSNLTSVVLPDTINGISNHCFSSCENLQKCKLPQGLKYISEYAFYGCSKLNTRIPSSIKKISYDAFNGTNIDTIVIPNEAIVRGAAFNGNSNLKYLQLPTNFYHYTDVMYHGGLALSCKNLNTIVLESPTVVSGNVNRIFSQDNMESRKLVVPNYLVNSYKLDSYWYNYDIQGFSTAKIKDWHINAPLVLNARDRFEGEPNLILHTTGSMKINGEKEMVIDTLSTSFILSKYENKNSLVMSKCKAINIKGAYQQKVKVNDKEWYFFCLPVDIKVNEITNDANAQFAIRYYDGAQRAESGMGHSWKNYKNEDVIEAGTGFILQSNKDATYTFTAVNNDSKQNPVKYEEFFKPLKAYAAAQPANAGWNLVGNPYLTYYNIHKLNFTAPITVRGLNRNDNPIYIAYSIVDDDYALKAGEAFFVQCPEEMNTISFPLEGRQLTATIDDQNATRPMNGKTEKGVERQLVDIQLEQNGFNDKTRIVFNENAQLSYEMSCDAAKFMNTEKVSQIYTLDQEGNAYAINERPEADGLIHLGFIAAQDGDYSFHITRCGAESVFVTDHVTGQTVELSHEDYHFTAKAGTDNQRFTLSIRSKEVTGIEEMTTTSVKSVNGGLLINGNATIYGTDGRLIQQVAGQDQTIQLPSGIYVVKSNGNVRKVSVNR